MGTHPTTRLVEFFTDNANEYYSKPLQAFYNEHGIQYNTTIPYTPEQNSISERINRTLCDIVRAALHSPAPSPAPNTLRDVLLF